MAFSWSCACVAFGSFRLDFGIKARSGVEYAMEMVVPFVDWMVTHWDAERMNG
jgi:hypothetical protein